MNRFFSPKWHYLTLDKKPNYLWAVKEYFEEVNKNNSEETKDRYFVSYNNIIFPIINPNIPIDEYDDIQIQNILELLRNNRDLNEITVDSYYDHLVIDPFESYLKHYKKEDESWGYSYKIVIPKGETLETILAKIPKSFNAEQNKKIHDSLYSSYECDGEIIGLGLVNSLGCRLNESCGVSFNDIHEMKHYPGVYYITIGHVTTKINSNDLKTRGKSWNSPRRIPLTDELYLFLKNRQNYIESIVGPCGNFPIVCKDNRFDIRCDTPTLSKAGNIFFKDTLKIGEQIVSGASIEMVKNHEEIINDKSPTTYILRRNFATKIYNLGFNLAQCQYIMGHEIEDLNTQRSDFADEYELYKIYKLLNNKPIL